MAVKLEGSIRRWIGLSTDEKPFVGVQFDGTLVEAKDLPAGSSFLEQDTGRIFRWTGTEWVVPAADDLQLVVLQALLREVTQLREVVELVVTNSPA